jgi:hypothetical protein
MLTVRAQEAANATNSCRTVQQLMLIAHTTWQHVPGHAESCMCGCKPDREEVGHAYVQASSKEYYTL